MSWRGLPPPAAETAASAVYLAIDVGHDRLAAGVVNDYGEVVVRDRVATPARDVWPALQRLVRRVVAARPEDAGALLACGVTCEGPIDKDDGTVTPLHMPSLVGFTLRQRVHDLTRLPTVLATSAQARVLAERWIGGARGVADVMVLLLADAVEAGVVSNGRLLGGRRGNAGQIGHLNVEPNGLACVCGARGCLWAYASATSLQAEINRPLRRAPAAVVERTGVMIGRAVASAAAVFDLRLVLLSGSVPATFGQPLLEAATRELDQRTRIAFLRSMPDRARPLVQLGLDDARSGVGVDRCRRARSPGIAAGAAGEVVGGVRWSLTRRLAPCCATRACGRSPLRQLRRSARRDWWRRPPFLPVPSADYVCFRLITQYGDPAAQRRRRRTSWPTSGGAATGPRRERRRRRPGDVPWPGR